MAGDRRADTMVTHDLRAAEFTNRTLHITDGALELRNEPAVEGIG